VSCAAAQVPRQQFTTSLRTRPPARAGSVTAG
jgi:hypothetical protein